MSLKRTLQGGPPPYRKEKSRTNMKDLEAVVDMQKVKSLEAQGVGYNMKITSAAKYLARKVANNLQR